MVAFPWDEQSDQPHIVADRVLRRRLRRGGFGELTALLATCAWWAPLWALAYARAAAPPRQLRDIVGVAISPSADPRLATALADLGIGRLAIRCPLWDPAGQEAVWRCLEDVPHEDVLLVVPQDRRAVNRPETVGPALERICRQAPVRVRTVQFGNAVNRLKWGCAHLGEYLPLLAEASAVVADFPRLQLAGSAVIDFEPLATLRSLVNRFPIRADICSALLYVDRRGGPRNRQYLIFDTARKIRTVAAALRLSRRIRPRLWLTEVNWPLAGHDGWAPTSPTECVDEATAADYLRDYLQIAAATGLVERVYVWQLVACGYGLIDPRDWRRRPAFDVLKKLVQQ